jgi:ABC-type amino acid transport substrate-binding protein/nitrogen-specific signal transduction histidine kinase/HPt (histidine-containing phosphotransfer) domain-containing protein/ActR/RegA family two-component response regulator
VNLTRVFVVLLTLLCWLPALLAAAGPGVELTRAERDWLDANPRILIGSDAGWRPFVWREQDGSAAGIEADLVKRINALTGANIQLVLGEWADMVARAEAGELHGLAASARHAERAERFLFSVSPYATHKFIFTRRGSTISSMDDLAGRRVGLLRRNLSDLKLLDAWPAIIRVELDSPLALAVAVENGDVDAAISSANMAWIATENMLPALRLAFPVPGSKLDLRYSIGKEHAPLLGIIDKALAAIEPVEMMRILRKWGDEEQPNIVLSADERAWLAQKNSVRVRIGEAPPWEINHPEPAGMAVDYLRIIAKLFDIDFRFVPAEDSWAEGFEDIAGSHRKYDLLPAAKRTDERLATLAMSEDYLSSPWAIFTRNDRRDIRDLDDLRGRTVTIERGYVMHDLLAATEPTIVLSVQATHKDALLAVSSGRADAYVGNLLVTDYLMQAHGIVNLKVAGPTPFGEHKQAMVTRQAWAPLISLIDKGLNAIPAEQHIAIRQRWLTSVAKSRIQAPLDLSADERAWLAANPSFRVGAYPLPPYIQEQGGRVDGYLAELIRAIAARAGLRAELQYLTLEQVKAGTERGTLDVTLAVNPTPERARVLLFSQGTVDFTLSIFARKEARDIQGLESLVGKTLATYPGYSWNVRFPEYLPDTRIVTAADVEDMFRTVSAGQADAAISETESGKALLRRALLTNVEPKAFAVFDGQRSRRGHYYGVVRRLPLLASILDKSFAALPDSEKQRIWNRWFTQQTAAGEVDLDSEERAYLDVTVVRRALASAWMPFDFAAADGAPTGVAEDYWTLIRDKLGLREERGERQPFSDILAAMERGDIDLYAATTRTADRERFALFSDPYERYPIAIAGGANAGLFAGTASLDGRRVAVGRDYSAHHLLKARSPGIDFVLVDDTRAALEAVAAGRAEAAVDILPVLHQQIEGFPPGRVKLVGVTDLEFPLQVMVGRQQAPLLPLINRAIAAITPEERAAIHNRWLLRQVVTAPDYTLLWQVLVAALLILLTILYWNRRLHREVERRKRAETELLHAKDMADRASRAKGDFLANMSHEIRTPLNAVIGLTRLSLETDPAPALREYLGKIDLSARTLLALIDDVLDLSRIEADKLQPRQQPLELAAVLARVRAMVEQQAAEKGIELRIEGPAEPIGALLGDGLRLTQVLLNLVGNAVKFTNRGRVTLAAWVEDEDESALTLTFAVTDTGIGIPEERRADLFDPFTQVDTSSTRGHGGSGLGLAISARLVALMGGRLEMESIAGQGSCFWFSLAFPRAPEEAKEIAVPMPELETLHGIRVLVAEDDPVSQLLARDLLSRRGAAVTLAATGAEAVAAAAGGDFDIVLMDVRMPEMDGLEACRRIRALPNGGPPIVALTANALAGERERCLAVGMDGYLTKPLDQEALYAELSRWLRLPSGEVQVPRPASAVAAQPLMPGFDAVKVRRWQDQAPDAWRSMVRTFVAEYPASATAIGAALEADDRPRARDLLHRLRGAAGALGAEDLTAAAERLELALASDGPVDAQLPARLFASAEAALAVLAELKMPAEEDTSARGAGLRRRDQSQRMRELEALLEAGNTRALDHISWLEGWARAEAPREGRELLRHIEALDFPAALETLHRLDEGVLANPR